MDRRDFPPIGPPHPRAVGPDGPEPADPPTGRLAGLVSSPVARRLAISKVGRAVVASAVVIGLLVVGGSNVWRSMETWLHRQTVHRLDFGAIELDPPPPGWIKGGRAALLEQVRADRAHLKSVSMLELSLDALLTDFRRNPWISRAEGAARDYPNRVRVRLAYREPVASVRTEHRGTWIVDREAVVLPADEVDTARAGRLVTIVARDPAGEPVAGLVWPGDPAEMAPARPGAPSPLLLAANLAGFLKDRSRDRADSANPPVPEFVVFARDEPRSIRGLYVVLEGGTHVYWSGLADLDDPSAPGDTEKWRRLVDRAGRDGGLRVRPRDEFFDFNREGIEVRRWPRPR